jgi:hypothetical protein
MFNVQGPMFKVHEIRKDLKCWTLNGFIVRPIEGRFKMKKNNVFILMIVVGFFSFSCASTGGMSDTSKGAAVGAGLGAIAGQVIGSNTAGTLIGAAGGALGGAIVGHEMDYQKQKNIQNAQQQRTYAAPENVQQPPGQWVDVPGQWNGGKWVPSHKVWVPVNP